MKILFKTNQYKIISYILLLLVIPTLFLIIRSNKDYDYEDYGESTPYKFALLKSLEGDEYNWEYEKISSDDRELLKKHESDLFEDDFSDTYKELKKLKKAGLREPLNLIAYSLTDSQWSELKKYQGGQETKSKIFFTTLIVLYYVILILWILFNKENRKMCVKKKAK